MGHSCDLSYAPDDTKQETLPGSAQLTCLNMAAPPRAAGSVPLRELLETLRMRRLANSPDTFGSEPLQGRKEDLDGKATHVSGKSDALLHRDPCQACRVGRRVL